MTGVKSGTAFWKMYMLGQALRAVWGGLHRLVKPSHLCEISVKHRDYPPAVSVSSNAQEMIPCHPGGLSLKDFISVSLLKM